MGKNDDNVTVSYKLLADYFNAVADLCATLEYDLKNGNKITSKTVVNLSKTVSVGNKITEFIDVVTESDVKYN